MGGIIARNAKIRRTSSPRTDIVDQMAILRIHVVPNAKSDSVAGMFATATPSRGGYGDAVKVKLRAPAIEGKANAALVRFLAAQLKLPQHAIVLQRGHKSRDKLIRIEGLSEEEARRRLAAQA